MSDPDPVPTIAQRIRAEKHGSLPPLVVDEREARRLLGGLCAKTMYNLRQSGALQFLKIGTRTMYRVSDLIAFAEGGAVQK